MEQSEALRELERMAEDCPTLDQQAVATVIAGCAIAGALSKGLGGGLMAMNTPEALVNLGEKLELSDYSAEISRAMGQLVEAAEIATSEKAE